MAPSTRANPALQRKISQMRLTIAPIVHIETGVPPPDFPHTMLQLFLLTESQLDAMAAYYSQTTPNAQTYLYPQTMDWNQSILEKSVRPGDVELKVTDFERLKIKMRMFARFIGMRNAETPGWEVERQIELLTKRIERDVEEEMRRESGRKWYRGPPTFH